MKVKELKKLLDEADEDAEVIIFNDGSFFEWYGTERLEPSMVIMMPEIVYILLGYDEFEAEAVNEHYAEYLRGRKTI